MQREGPGWRLAIDKQRQGYQALIASDDWALELTTAEFEQFRNMCGKIVDQYKDCLDHLMAEENLELCLEEGAFWFELRGDCNGWALRFVLSSALGERGAEGSWQRSTASAFCEALALAEVY